MESRSRRGAELTSAGSKFGDADDESCIGCIFCGSDSYNFDKFHSTRSANICWLNWRFDCGESLCSLLSLSASSFQDLLVRGPYCKKCSSMVWDIHFTMKQIMTLEQRLRSLQMSVEDNIRSYGRQFQYPDEGVHDEPEDVEEVDIAKALEWIGRRVDLMDRTEMTLIPKVEHNDDDESYNEIFPMVEIKEEPPDSSWNSDIVSTSDSSELGTQDLGRKSKQANLISAQQRGGSDISTPVHKKKLQPTIKYERGRSATRAKQKARRRKRSPSWTWPSSRTKKSKTGRKYRKTRPQTRKSSRLCRQLPTADVPKFTRLTNVTPRRTIPSGNRQPSTEEEAAVVVIVVKKRKDTDITDMLHEESRPQTGNNADIAQPDLPDPPPQTLKESSRGGRSQRSGFTYLTMAGERPELMDRSNENQSSTEDEETVKLKKRKDPDMLYEPSESGSSDSDDASVPLLETVKEPASAEDHPTNTNRTPYNCILCGKVYSSSGLGRHFQTVHPEHYKKGGGLTGRSSNAPPKKNKINKHEIQCSYCSVTLRHPSYLHSHMKEEHPAITFVCPVCDKRFRMQLKLDNHLKNMHGKIFPHYCSTCGLGFDSQEEMTDHEPIHKSANPFTCSICSVILTNIEDLKRHISSHLNPFHCAEAGCGKSFPSNEILERHTKRHTQDTQESSAICDICGKSVQSFQLRQHMSFHSQERNYRCHLCPGAYKTKSYLNRHLRVHTGERRCACRICGKQFVDTGLRKTHEQLHSGIKPYPCEVCGKGFASKEYARRHALETHHGKRRKPKIWRRKTQLEPKTMQVDQNVPDDSLCRQNPN